MTNNITTRHYRRNTARAWLEATATQRKLGVTVNFYNATGTLLQSELVSSMELAHYWLGNLGYYELAVTLAAPAAPTETVNA